MSISVKYQNGEEIKTEAGINTFDRAYMLCLDVLDDDEVKNVTLVDDTYNPQKEMKIKNFTRDIKFLLFLDYENIQLESYATDRIDDLNELNKKYEEFLTDMSNLYENETDWNIDLKDEEKKKYIMQIMSKGFENYIKKYVLKEKAVDEVFDNIGHGNINSNFAMRNLLQKYKINENINQDIYNEVKESWNSAIRHKTYQNYKKEILDNLTENQYFKYYGSVFPTKEEIENSKESDPTYFNLNYNMSNYKKIVENIETIENEKSPIKFLILGSENNNFKTGEVLNLEDFKHIVEKTIDEIFKAKVEDGFIGYDKLNFLPIIDKDGKVKVLDEERFDLGDYREFDMYLSRDLKTAINETLGKNQNEKYLSFEKIAEKIASFDAEVGYIDGCDIADETKNYQAILENGDIKRAIEYIEDELGCPDNNLSQNKRLENILKDLKEREQNSIFYKLGSLQDPLYYKSRPMFEEYEGKEGSVNLNDFFLYYANGKDLVKNGYNVGDVSLNDINKALEKSNLKQIYFYKGKHREKEFLPSNISFSSFAEENEKEYKLKKQNKKLNEEEM